MNSDIKTCLERLKNHTVSVDEGHTSLLGSAHLYATVKMTKITVNSVKGTTV
jgi:hypothetical protein